MKTPIRLLVLFCAAGMTLVSPAISVAADRGEQPFADPHLREYPYNADQIYTAQPRADKFTDFQVRPDEKLTEVYLSDKAPGRWRMKVSQNRQHVLVKPVLANLDNSLLIITDRRTYSVTLLPSISANSKAVWDQRITWSGDDGDAAWVSPDAATAGAKRRGVQRAAGDSDSPEPVRANLDSVHADYTISGNANIRPVAVYDNGRVTKIVFPSTLQTMPTVLVAGADGQLELPNWTVEPKDPKPNDERAIVVSQLFTKAVLKLGDAKVEIENHGFPTPSAGAQVK
ncbi:TrbG/VirB9 family P-type conjugative transfer protein (plasmid) [Burkholderia cenocepacia]|uniref:TrbG/VirB9 family P-type conjugative transfer protein n=1 Tax=Burkholderia cenocepacia TaxID=95486 RepID=UPI00209D25E4|nr:TrbG/VirB9 family P-type conjugative transfer protein [Burkholderia cenocepacia]MCO8402814.1 TrbG/VirB9 family P-type conjugative transfer protein [Burkholderia cenocepacia]MCO8415053.1 TrbG/VirB9 family P-type conjugative transfer protein [Burkholderia cenocepacia]MCO8423051.1 TrbG/VirB9 family P-type conjugative transfer protein [Burkholderia cenocepacia]MCO8474800.1 TrbG/VirB9 family P-type conjugative transfer protein [Burkholderia cenocepacia]MCO8482020.1 TrbG/VirB9 family P-type conju